MPAALTKEFEMFANPYTGEESYYRKLRLSCWHARILLLKDQRKVFYTTSGDQQLIPITISKQ